MTQFSIPVVEYKSARPGGAKTPAHKPFVINERQLIVSMVRSTLTANSGKASRKYMAAIVKPTLMFLLDRKRSPNFCVSADFLYVLRDFSATTRIGELAQGVSYAFWKWERGYSWIADFGPWAAGLVPAYAGSKSPDFVMLNPITNDIAFMESKGTGSSCHKAPMNRALSQCKAALSHIAVSRGLGCVLTLDSKTPAGIGTLHIRDPEKRVEITDEMKHYLFRHSYASWFDLTGDQEQAAECRQRSPTKKEALENTESVSRRKENFDIALRDITTAAIGFDPTRTNYEIDAEIKKALKDINVFKKLNWQKLSERMQANPNAIEKEMRFPDGTYIVERLPWPAYS